MAMNSPCYCACKEYVYVIVCVCEWGEGVQAQLKDKNVLTTFFGCFYFVFIFISQLIGSMVSFKESSSFMARNQYCVMKKRNMFHMNKMDFKFSKVVIPQL